MVSHRKAKIPKNDTGFDYIKRWAVRADHTSLKKSQAKKPVNGTSQKEKRTICQDKALVAGHQGGSESRET